MKERDQNLAPHARDNPKQPIPPSGKSQQRGNKNTPEITPPAVPGTPKKEHPEKWQGSHPTKRQDEQQPGEKDVDEEENPTEIRTM